VYDCSLHAVLGPLMMHPAADIPLRIRPPLRGSEDPHDRKAIGRRMVSIADAPSTGDLERHVLVAKTRESAHDALETNRDAGYSKAMAGR
jgi:hypothetical protein